MFYLLEGRTMSTTDQFLLALQAYQEIQAELCQQEEIAPAATPVPVQVEPVADGSLLLGLGEDGLPLTLNLYDPTPGPLLVAGDGGCGKTALLQSLAGVSDASPDIQFGVLTPFPEEWRGLEAMPNNLGIWPAYHPAAGDFLAQLVSWAEALPETRQAVLLLVDGLELMSLDSTTRYLLRWLLVNGPERQVWPVVTVNPARMIRLGSLLEYFQTRILGHVRRYQTAQLLIGEPPVNLAALIPGSQFYLSSPQDCLRFWLPPIEGVSNERGNALV
jgi:hypothetical protein